MTRDGEAMLSSPTEDFGSGAMIDEELEQVLKAARRLVDAMEVEFGMMDTRMDHDDIDRAEGDLRDALEAIGA